MKKTIPINKAGISCLFLNKKYQAQTKTITIPDREEVIKSPAKDVINNNIFFFEIPSLRIIQHNKNASSMAYTISPFKLDGLKRSPPIIYKS